MADETPSARQPQSGLPEGMNPPAENDRPQSRMSDSQRQSAYNSQRVTRSSRPNTADSQASARSRGKRAEYSVPEDFENLDEQAVPPPIENPDEAKTYRQQSGLEENIRQAKRSSYGSPSARRSRHGSSAHRPSSAIQGQQQELSEVAAPPPVQTDLDQEAEGDLEHQRYLEDARRGEDADDEESPPFQPKRPQDYFSKAAPPKTPRALTELYAISYLVFFSILGTLARLGVQWITFFPGSPVVTPVIWANFGGSLIMGFLAEDQGLFRSKPSPEALEKNGGRRGSRIKQDIEQEAKADHSKRKKTIPLYIGLATGFCGSFTSFSSFARDYFLALSNNLPTPVNHPHPGASAPTITSTSARNGGYSFEAFVAVIFSTLALSLGALIIGAHIALFLDPYTPRVHGRFVRLVVDPLVVFLGFGCWLGAVFMAIWPPDRPSGPSSRGSWSNETWRGEVIFALVFAPLGCLLRFYASLKLNGLVPAFPLGTFAVNMLGTAVLGMCYDIQHVGVGVMGRIGGGRVGCQVLEGIIDGFCGCLTTVSTWVAEINGLKRKHGWAYAFSSMFGGLCLMVVIMGSVKWSVGFSSPACNTGYTSKVNG